MARKSSKIGLQEQDYTIGGAVVQGKGRKLITLAVQHEERNLTLTQFAGLLNMNRANLNRLLKKLEKKGLIHRRDLGVFTTLHVPNGVKAALKMGGGLSPSRTTRVEYIDDFEMRLPFKLEPQYRAFFEGNEMWNLAEGPNKKTIYANIDIIKTDIKDGQGFFVLRFRGKTFGNSKDDILLTLKTRLEDTITYLKTKFRGLTIGIEAGNLKKLGKVQKVEYEIADEASKALYNLLGPGEHTLARNKDGKREFLIHASDGLPERVYPHEKSFYSLSEVFEKEVFEPYRDGTAYYPKDVTRKLHEAQSSEFIHAIARSPKKQIEAIIEFNKALHRANTQEARNLFMLELIRAENPALAHAVEENPILYAHLKTQNGQNRRT